MKKVLALLVLAALAGAYLAGLWPERQRRVGLEDQVRALERRVEDAEARVRLAALLGEIQNLAEVAALMNYGQAQPLSSRFFDGIAAESNRAQPVFKGALDRVLALRDPVTASLTRGDPSVLEHLRQAERHLKAALGWPQSTPTPAPAATPSPPESNQAT